MPHPCDRLAAGVRAVTVAPVAAFLGAALGLAGCGELLRLLPGEPPPGAIPVAAEGSAAPGGAAADYPSLATVPPRPQLGYGLEQRRAVEDELVGDRERAAYLEGLLDYETGRAATPPAPPPAVATPVDPNERAVLPPRAAPAAGEDRVRGPGDDPAVEAQVEEALARDEDDGRLKDFLRRLERPGPAVAGPDPAPRAATPRPAAPRALEPTRPAAELERFGGHLGGVLGMDAGGAVVATVPFGRGSSALPASAEAELGRALEQARAAGVGLRIAGGGPGGGPVPVARTRAVAVALLRLGATPEMLALSPGGGAEEVRVSLTSGVPSQRPPGA